MNQSKKDELAGSLHQAAGAVKTTVGKATDNPKLTAEGQTENLSGKVQRKVGQVERVLEK
jgi:uncharacterized protein YjbJ (UPF0337 family)